MLLFIISTFIIGKGVEGITLLFNPVPTIVVVHVQSQLSLSLPLLCMIMKIKADKSKGKQTKRLKLEEEDGKVKDEVNVPEGEGGRSSVHGRAEGRGSVSGKVVYRREIGSVCGVSWIRRECTLNIWRCISLQHQWQWRVRGGKDLWH